MSRSKEVILQKQQEWGDKILEQLRTSKAIRVNYEEREKKKAIPNRLNMAESAEEEIKDKQETIERATIVYRQMLPSLLKKLSRIKDPRKPGKIKHKMTVLILYGILMFVYQIGSRRKVNQTMTRIRFENLQAMFPELETLPHADTLARLLEVIEVSEIQECMIELLKDLIRRKKFRNFLHNKNYLIAIDGTQKFYRQYQWDEKCLTRHVGKEADIPQYYVYVLESVLILNNGITLPLVSIFLKNEDLDKAQTKQDCELKAFYRMAKKLKQLFRNSKITVVVDGLYACGPVIETCRKNKWGYMIVLKEDAMKTVWQEAISLMKFIPENRLKVKWGDRDQVYFWANEIDYEYNYNNKIHNLKLHVVICYETWRENHSRSTGELEEKQTRYAWISSKPLNETNVFTRCTKMGRYRWKIENNILTEKHQGYDYEHCYSYIWNAMEGYHYLMKIGRFLNVLAANSELLAEKVNELGIRGFIAFLNEACGGILLDKDKIQKAANKRQQWRLVYAA